MIIPNLKAPDSVKQTERAWVQRLRAIQAKAMESKAVQRASQLSKALSKARSRKGSDLKTEEVAPASVTVTVETPASAGNAAVQGSSGGEMLD